MATIALTGSTDGIGLAAARTLLAQGHLVLIHGRNEQRGQPVVDVLAADPSCTGEAVLVTGDLSSLDEVRALAGQLATHGPLDVLAHNAGVWVRGGRRGSPSTASRRPSRSTSWRRICSPRCSPIS